MELADINRREVLRYLGYKNQEADENVSRIVEECFAKIPGEGISSFFRRKRYH